MEAAAYSDLAPMRLEPVELRGAASGGRSRPLRVQCKSTDGALHEVILKLSDPMVPDNYPWRLCLSRELVGAMLARRLGLRVPNYAIVDVDEAFVRATVRSSEGERVRRSAGPNFGSLVVDNVFDNYVPRDLATWTGALTFDALGFNADRMAPNPNVLWDGRTMFLIDHGMLAPTWTFSVDGLTGASLFGEPNIRLHAGYQVIKGSGASFQAVSDSWVESVDATFIRWTIDQVPQEWANLEERKNLSTFLRARAGIAASQVEELRRIVK